MAAKKGAKATQIENKQTTAVLESVKNVSLQKAVEQVGTVSVTVQKGMADLMSSMQAEINKLTDISAAIDIKKEVEAVAKNPPK
jgi:hypothetical protein